MLDRNIDVCLYTLFLLVNAQDDRRIKASKQRNTKVCYRKVTSEDFSKTLFTDGSSGTSNKGFSIANLLLTLYYNASVNGFFLA